VVPAFLTHPDLELVGTGKLNGFAATTKSRRARRPDANLNQAAHDR
jgi:hypothetical protein